MRFRFELSTPHDDDAIRHLLAETAVPGAIRMVYEREPNYFLGCRTHGPFAETLVAREEETGALAAVAVRAVRPLWVNGKTENAGYLGQLRIHPRFRGRWLLARGFRFLRELHKDGRATRYLTTLIEGNHEAEALLVEHPRPSMPRYEFLANIVTLALETRDLGQGAGVVTAEAVPFHGIQDFLEMAGKQRPLFPVVEATELQGTGSFPGFSPRDLFVALEGGKIVGTLGLWDQSGFKQHRVVGYSRGLSLLRPAYNAVQRLRGGALLPPAGERLKTGFATLLTARDSRVFRALLSSVLTAARGRNFSHLILALAQGDPFLSEASRFRHVPYRSTLYSVAWDGEGQFNLSGAFPHVEAGAL